jgi:hypothetical protein
MSIASNPRAQRSPWLLIGRLIHAAHTYARLAARAEITRRIADELAARDSEDWQASGVKQFEIKLLLLLFLAVLVGLILLWILVSWIVM